MRFPQPLRRGRLVRRYKRFLADVVLDDGAAVTAHCPNPGAMLGLAETGREVWLSASTRAARRLPYTLELVRDDDGAGADGGLVGVNTLLPNRLVAEAVAAGTIAPLAGYDRCRREVPYNGDSRIDLLLEAAGRPPCYAEVKNVHLRRRDGPHPTAAEFPDCVTRRGARHLAALAAMAGQGARAVMVFVVQRGDCDHLRLAGDLDPAFRAAFVMARTAGVEPLCYACRVGMDGIDVATPLPVVV